MFEAITFAPLGYGDDIAPSTMALGDGWCELESDGSERFRRITNEAQAVLASAGVVHAVMIDLEPAEATAPALTLEARVDGTLRYSGRIRGRTLVRFVIPGGEPGMRSTSLRASGGSARVYRFAALPHPCDVVPEWDGFRIADGGWYPLEEIDGALVRYVNREAAIVIGRPARTLELDIEAGPGLAYAAFELGVCLGGQAPVHRVLIECRTRITLELPELRSLPERIVLSCEGGGRPTPPDARLRDFRVFSAASQAERVVSNDSDRNALVKSVLVRL